MAKAVTAEKADPTASRAAARTAEIPRPELPANTLPVTEKSLGGCKILTMTDLDEYWSTYYLSGKDFHILSDESLNQIVNFVQKPYSMALDIGCGTGDICRRLAEVGFDPTGVDSSSEAIRIAKSKAGSKEKYVLADIEDENFNLSEKYDLVICKLVYAFIKNKPGFLEKVAKWMHTKSVFVIIVPLTTDVDSSKLRISVDEEQTQKELKEQFVVDSYRDEGQSVFICKLKGQ